MTDIGIVIVTYNSAAEIGPCLDAALRTGSEVVVIDHASTDSTITELVRRGTRLIANPVNRGFAAAVNQGFAVLNGSHILVLNPDAVLKSGFGAPRGAGRLQSSPSARGGLLG